jgi:hypothetical protein
MDISNVRKFIICSKCGAINKADNTNCIKCGAVIDSYIVDSDFIQPNFNEMTNNIPGNYLTEAGKITPDLSDIFVEPEEEDVFVPEPDEFGLNGILPKKSASSANQQSIALPPPVSNKRSIKFPLEIAGLSVIITSIILLTIGIATLNREDNTETAEAVVTGSGLLEDYSSASSANSYDKFIDAYKTLEDDKEIELKSSRTYSFVRAIKKENTYYVSMTDIDLDKAESDIQIAVNDKDIAIIEDGKEYSIYTYIDDMKYTEYAPLTKTARSRTLDQQSYDALGLKNYFLKK